MEYGTWVLQKLGHFSSPRSRAPEQLGCGSRQRTSLDGDWKFTLPVVLEEEDEAPVFAVASRGRGVRVRTLTSYHAQCAVVPRRRRHFSEGSGETLVGCGRNYYLVDDLGR